MIVTLILFLAILVFALYQTKTLQEVKKERDALKKRIEDIEDGTDEELKSKRETIVKLKKEIEELYKRVEYIKMDQVELNKEYEYLKERNSQLENAIHNREDILRRGDKS